MNCKQCGKSMNPVEAMISATHQVCGTCTRKNHRTWAVELIGRRECIEKMRRANGYDDEQYHHYRDMLDEYSGAEYYEDD